MARRAEKPGPNHGIQGPSPGPCVAGGTTKVHGVFQVEGRVFHVGDSVSAGHYRAFWPLQPWGMAVSDDFVRPSVAGASDSTRISRGSYLCFLERAE